MGLAIAQRARGAVLTAITAVVIAGCSLPGYELDTDNSAWYALSSDDPRYHADPPPQAQLEYEPVVKQITAGLILRLRAQEAQEAQDAPDALVAQDQAVGDGIPPIVDYPDYVYELGVGDVLSVTVFGHPELTNPGGPLATVGLAGGARSAAGASAGRMVNAKGKLFFPYVGVIQAAGRTVSDIREQITEGLTRVIRQPQVDVRVVEYRSQAAYVVGDVPQPCRVPISDLPRTVIDALVECSALGQAQRGSSQGAAEPNTWPSVTLIRDGEPRPIPLARLYRHSGPKPRLVLRDGDRIYLADDKRVYMVGEFLEQAVVPIPASGLSLARAIGAAGGLTVASADPEEIYVIRGYIEAAPTGNGELVAQLQPLIFHLDASSVDALILAEQFELQAKDIVFAAPAELVNFNRALALILPSVSLLFRTAIIRESVSSDR